MSSHNAQIVEQPDGARLQTPRRVTRNGGAVRVRPHALISDTASALVSEIKSKKGRVAPDPDKKWKVIRRYDTSNTARLDPEDRKYDQYQHARDWMEKSGMKMLPEHIPERDELHLWKLFRSSRAASNRGVSIREYKCPMLHLSGCRAGLRIVRCDGFEQLERCGSHNLDSHVSRATSDEEDQDSDFPDLVPDGSDDEEEQSEKEDEEKEEEEEEEFNSGSASGTDADYHWLTIFLHALISICFAVEEESDSDAIQSNGFRRIQPDGFDRDGYDGSGPTLRVRRLPAVVLSDPKFGTFYTNEGAEWEDKLLRDRMERHGLKVTCRTQEHYDITMAHISRFGITVTACLRRTQFISINMFIICRSDAFDLD